MARKKQIAVKEDVSANLIAMIDIMFLLLLFFMLGADMTQRELAELVLPNADQVEQEKKEKAENDEFRSTVNVCHKPESAGRCVVNAKGGVCREMEHWIYEIRSNEYTMLTIEDEIKQLAAGAMDADINPIAQKRMSKRKISIRGDKFAPYGHVQHLITLCGQAGIFMIEVAAAKPPAEKG